MRRIGDLTGKVFGYLTALSLDTSRRRHGYVCRCKCGTTKSVSASSLVSGHTRSCGCYNKERLTEAHTGHRRNLGRVPHNWEDRTGKRHRKLIFLKYLGGCRWECLCDCGNTTIVLTTNLDKTTGCRSCAHRQDITGERIALLVAVSFEQGPLKRPPLWTFQCDCGNTIQGTVREFRAQWLRSCGCMDNAHSSWSSMMARCYEEGNNRYNSYGGRGIKVCERWHDFANFIADMGERPKRHNLGRKHAEKDYGPGNCFWEHVSKNCRDTKNDGMPTRPGRLKGARPRVS